MAMTLVNRPQVPGSVTINGKPESNGMSTHADSSVTIRASLRANAFEAGQVRMILRWSRNKDMSGGGRKVSEWGGNRTEAISIGGLQKDVRYYIRVYCEQRNLPFVSDYNAANFWTERFPIDPELLGPADNITVAQGDGVTVQWKHRDADTDPADPQARAQIQYRIPANSVSPAGPTTTATLSGSTAQYTIPASALRANTFYEWRVRTSDTHTPGAYGVWSDYRSFFVLGSDTAPILDYPINNEAVPVDVEIPFEWTFRDPSGDSQEKADLRYRVAGTEFWTTLTGDPDPGVPGSSDVWMITGGTLQPGYRYEWQVRTYDDSGIGNPSDWSESEFFYSILTPGWKVEASDWFGPTQVQGALGIGQYKVFAYDQGGERYKGEIGPLSLLRWGRVRDDISTATLFTSGFGEDCCALLSELRSWAHEIVVFRDGVRVWEGPITRLAAYREGFEIEARDPMAYVYRRIMRQGYNDNYRLRKGVNVGTRTVVDRAALIIANALAPHDPNVLPWMTRFDFDDDARESRSVLDWTKTAWEEVDSLAATAGLDYTTVGRRIILHDTHRPIGLLGEMRESDFFDPPVITEYGMSGANVFGVTNNAGLWGSYEVPRDEWGGVGPIEMLASEYGESDTGGTPETLTPAQRAQKREVLSKQARRNISGRWPSPLVVRVPDNSQLHPEANVGINQLVPGVHIPLRAKTLCKEVAQMQKLDSVSVEVTGKDEKVRVVMSPAPNEGVDPDLDGLTEA